MQPTRRETLQRRAWTALLAGLLVLLPAAPASAHGAGDSDQARVLVVDALSYLANQPEGYQDSVTDKVGDALEAPDTEGVDLKKVKAAKRALAAGDMASVRTLLQSSLEPLTAPVTGEETGTTKMLDPMPGHTSWGAGNLALAALSTLAVLAGLLLARRWRPAVRLRELRSHSSGGEAR